MAAAPDAYRWSSYHRNAEGSHYPLMMLHRAYQALARGNSQRQSAYRELLRHAISDERRAEIRIYFHQQRVPGSLRFQAHIEAMLGPQSSIQPCRRPKSSDKSL